MSLSLYLYIYLYVYITPHSCNKHIVRQIDPPYTRPPKVMNKLRDEQTARWTNCACTGARAQPAESVFANMYTLVKNTCVTYIPPHTLVLKSSIYLLCMSHLPQKNQLTPAQVRLFQFWNLFLFCNKQQMLSWTMMITSKPNVQLKRHHGWFSYSIYIYIYTYMYTCAGHIQLTNDWLSLFATDATYHTILFHHFCSEFTCMYIYMYFIISSIHIRIYTYLYIYIYIYIYIHSYIHIYIHIHICILNMHINQFFLMKRCFTDPHHRTSFAFVKNYSTHLFIHSANSPLCAECKSLWRDTANSPHCEFFTVRTLHSVGNASPFENRFFHWPSSNAACRRWIYSIQIETIPFFSLHNFENIG